MSPLLSSMTTGIKTPQGPGFESSLVGAVLNEKDPRQLEQGTEAQGR